MAYFSNGSEGMDYQARYCENCVNFRDQNDGRGPGCPVWDLHWLYASEECNSESNAKKMLDTLIPMSDDGLYPQECAMFIDVNEYGRAIIDEVPAELWADHPPMHYQTCPCGAENVAADHLTSSEIWVTRDGCRAILRADPAIVPTAKEGA